MTMNGWIKCSERIPDKAGFYITWIDGPSVVNNVVLQEYIPPFSKGGTPWWWSDTGKVTHWMPLPEPPKEIAK